MKWEGIVQDASQETCLINKLIMNRFRRKNVYRMKKFIGTLCLLFATQLFGQEIPIYTIDEVTIVGFSTNYQVGFNVSQLSDSILKNSKNSLIEILNENFNLYFKQQGYGMTASLSLRGTGASHTGVYWNGIPINSNLNGQTDFNTILPKSFNTISLRKSGGSVLLGSGAMGGAINLQNNFDFNPKTTLNISAEAGSYQTYSSFVQAQYNTLKNSLSLGFGNRISENNYPYLGTDLVNENGQLNLKSFHLNESVKWGNNSQIYFKILLNFSDRNTSRTLYAVNNAKLVYDQQNALLGWNYSKINWSNDIKVARIYEKYHYIFNKTTPELFSQNLSEKYLAYYDTKFNISKKINLFSGISAEYLEGKGTDILNQVQQKGTFYMLFNHNILENFKYNLSVRKEWSNQFTIPIIFSIETFLKLNNNHLLKGNFSTNFRTPTLNDLYWSPGGNPYLKPEKSQQIEMNYTWFNTSYKVVFSIFNISSSDLIQWQPNASGYWNPVNIQKVRSRGIELEMGKKWYKNVWNTEAKINFSLTQSENRENSHQLMYVPYLMANAQWSTQYKDWNLHWFQLYNGAVYTTTDQSAVLSHFWVTDISLNKQIFHSKISSTFKVNNLFNRFYEVIDGRPMPNRNYSLSINFNF